MIAISPARSHLRTGRLPDHANDLGVGLLRHSLQIGVCVKHALARLLLLIGELHQHPDLVQDLIDDLESQHDQNEDAGRWVTYLNALDAWKDSQAAADCPTVASHPMGAPPAGGLGDEPLAVSKPQPVGNAA